MAETKVLAIKDARGRVADPDSVLLVNPDAFMIPNE
jgi:hypothetical protein